MNNISALHLEGNATRDPELRFTNAGMAVASFGVAVNKSRFNKQTNDWDEEVSFFDVVCFAQLAENVAETVTKGTSIIVIGRLKQDSWTDRDSGQKRSKVQIVADNIGPGLRNATAQVIKAERSDGPRTSSASPRAEAAPAYDEEPF